MMNLNNFEKYIESIIIIRGYNYFENDFINSIKEPGHNYFAAEVSGTEMYMVNVKIDDDLNIHATYCTCPYDKGEFCKHQAAVFYKLRAMKKNNKLSDGNNENYAGYCADEYDSGDFDNISTNSDLKNNPKGSIRNILSAISKEHIIDFLCEITMEYEEIRQRILLEFQVGDNEEEIAKAYSLIRTYIENNSDRDGFVSYMHTEDAIYGAQIILDKAENYIDEDRMLHALNLLLCVIGEMVDLIQGADDSDGFIGDVIENSFENIYNIVENESLSSIEKASIFDKLINEASKKRYDGWNDWRIVFITAASQIADTLDLRERLESKMNDFIKNSKPDSWSSQYFIERINLIKYEMISRCDGDQEALKYLENNLQFPEFRKIIIKMAIAANNYEKVIKLALEAENKDKNSPGLVNKWKEYRFLAYKKLGMLEEERSLAMEFIINGNFDYYKILKEMYSIDEWKDVYTRIIHLVEDKKDSYSSIYTKILIEEREKEMLLEYVKNRPETIDAYFGYLTPDFNEEGFKIYVKHIENTASRANNRNHYRAVCDIIYRLEKAGGKTYAAEIKQKLYNLYSNRPAFREELMLM